MELLKLNKIWDRASHNAFTDLIYFENYWYCTFREASSHMSYDGNIRIIRSKDSLLWEDVCSLEIRNLDLRDPKFSITPTNELMLNAGARVEDRSVVKNYSKSITWFSKDGINFGEANFCSENSDIWRWSITWHKGNAYSFAYQGLNNHLATLYTSKDGKVWTALKKNVYPKSDTKEWGNESSIVFIEDIAYTLLRRDGGDSSAVLGVSKPPYKTWNWKNLGQYVGGPKMINIDGKLFVSGRLSNEKEYYTALAWLDLDNMSLQEILRLPSKADSSYPGLVYKDKVVYISYYSSHEGRAAIYFAIFKINY